MRGSRAFVAFVVLSAVAGTGCSSSGDGASSTPGAAGAAGGSSWTTTACGTCAASACGKEHTACTEDPACGPWDACLSACSADATGLPLEACSGSCQGASSPAATAYLACLATRSSTCAACGAGGASGAGGAGGGAGGGGGPSNPIYDQMCEPSGMIEGCNKCQVEKCCKSVAAINGKAAQLSACWYACKDPACEYACFEKYPDQVADLGGWVACTYGNCGSKCTSNKCNLCQGDRCREELAACYTNSDCYLAVSCGLTCASGDVPCQAACADKYPGAMKPLSDYAVCISQQCPASCGK